jgi:uncharacterized protein DUF397
MNREEIDQLHWFKSTRSNGSGACVEIAHARPGVIAVRDSKDPYGPVISVAGTAFAALVDQVKTGRLG